MRTFESAGRAIVSSTPPVPHPELDEHAGDPGDAPPPSTGQRRKIDIGRFFGALLVPIATILAIGWTFEWLRTTDASRSVVVVVALLMGVVGIFLLFWGMDLVVNQLGERWQFRLRPWVFIGPALLLLGVFLVYPTVYTILISFQGPRSLEWVGLDNYRFLLSDAGMLRGIRNTALWVVIVPSFAVAIGLLVAVLADRLTRAEAFVKSMIFLPMAVSFVGASVVWALIYDFRSFGNQTGLLNGIWTAMGNQPIAWLSWMPWNNLYLMVIMIWMQTGFAMVILSAAIKAVPEDILEAARIDGANEFQIFFKVIIPTVMTSIVVVGTTITINVLKIFDIVYVTTGGQAGTEVIPERMVQWFFTRNHFGRGAAVAVIMFIVVIPVMLINVRRFRAEESIR
jgi:alpha-glucoside transport system permease protein